MGIIPCSLGALSAKTAHSYSDFIKYEYRSMSKFHMGLVVGNNHMIHIVFERFFTLTFHILGARTALWEGKFRAGGRKKSGKIVVARMESGGSRIVTAVQLHWSHASTGTGFLPIFFFRSSQKWQRKDTSRTSQNMVRLEVICTYYSSLYII